MPNTLNLCYHIPVIFEAEAMKKFLDEFREFAMKGNVLDLAVGVIIGGAFGKIVTSLVTDVIMPPLGIVLGGMDFTQLSVTLKPASYAANGQPTAPVMLNYGNFVQNVVDFLIIALVIFLMVKGANTLRKKKEDEKKDAKAKSPELSYEEKMLTEIRDLLKGKP